MVVLLKFVILDFPGNYQNLKGTGTSLCVVLTNGWLLNYYLEILTMKKLMYSVSLWFYTRFPSPPLSSPFSISFTFFHSPTFFNLYLSLYLYQFPFPLSSFPLFSPFPNNKYGHPPPFLFPPLVHFSFLFLSFSLIPASHSPSCYLYLLLFLLPLLSICTIPPTL